MKEILTALLLIVVFLFSCQQSKGPNDKNNISKKSQQSEEKLHEQASIEKPKIITYKMESAKQWLLIHKSDSLKLAIALAVNRTDYSNFSRMDSVVIPTNLSYDIKDYLPFPLNIKFLKDINKIIFFSYKTQTFAAYENGLLVYTGPTNMGRKKYLTPTGLFFTNWKAKVKNSTVNDEWVLKWNFNILNKEGIGWHQYSLPGYPASHSCLRLQKKDAKFLYNWADHWILAKKDNIHIKGTPVIIFGNYDFDSLKPSLQLISNSKSLDITAVEIRDITQAILNEILTAQKERDFFYQVSRLSH